MKVKGLLLGLCFLCLPHSALAALPEDFSYRGIYIGEAADDMLAKMEKPLYDKMLRVQGINVKYYYFRHDIVIGVAAKTGEVIDIQINDHDYTARDGIGYGATPYKIETTLGDVPHTFLDGVTYYIYDHPEKEHQHLLVATDPETGSLTTWRITGLPLTDEEADLMAMSDDDGDDSTMGLEDLTLRDKDIDTSALPPAEPVRLGGLG